MVGLKIIGDPAKAKELLKMATMPTVGLAVKTGDDATMKRLAETYPNVFKAITIEKHQATSNKMLLKRTDMKAK